MIQNLGFIGLGIMGRPMAHNLLENGYGLTVHNRSQPAVDELVAADSKAGTTIIDMSTIVPDVTRHIAKAASEKGIYMLDAPVSGSDKGAREMTLNNGRWAERGVRGLSAFAQRAWSPYRVCRGKWDGGRR